MLTTLNNDLVTDAQLANYAKLIYKRTGIRISPQKKTLLSNRLRRRLRKTGIEGYDDYFKHLNGLPPSDPEWDLFLQEITTHETFLFRDEIHWQWFRDTYLPQIASDARKEKRKRTLRILSAACSTGDEAFTIATCVAAELTTLGSWKIEILGTDIGVGAVEQARSAVFGERAMRLVPEKLQKRFFTKAKDVNIWHAKPMLTQMTRFRPHNLIEPLQEAPFDIVFLKNVLIYFDNPSKEIVLDHMRKVICPGGYLIAGAAEGIAGLVKDMRREHSWLFQKKS